MSDTGKDVPGNVTPTQERMGQNGGIAILNNFEGEATRYRAVWEHPLDAYYQLKAINKAEYQAGLKFSQAYYGAAICRTIDMRPTTKDQAELKPAWQEAILKQAYRDLPYGALNAVVDVCGHGEPIRSLRALEALRIGLGHLALLWNRVAIETCEHKKQ